MKDAQTALSHDAPSVTIEKYLNPEVILRFLAKGGDIETTLEQAILSGKQTLAFDPQTFVAQAMKSADGSDSLQDLLDVLEEDLERAGVSVPSV